MKIKKTLILLILGITLILSGCGGNGGSENKDSDNSKNSPGSEVNNDGLNQAVKQGIDNKEDYVSEVNIIKERGNLAALNHNKLLVSPDGKYVVFSAREKMEEDISKMPNSQLVLIDLYNGEVTELDRGQDIKVEDWFPDSKKILYRKLDNLFVLDISNTKSIKIAEGTYTGSISPDGAQVAFAEQGNGIYIVNADGSEKKQVTKKKGDWYPIWYPDGRQLFFFADRGVTLSDGAGQLQGMAKVNIETGKIEDILKEEKGKYRKATWIEPGKSLHINKGWDDGFYEMIVDLEKGIITDFGSNDTLMLYSTTVDENNNLVYKAEHDKVIVYNTMGEQVRIFPFEKPVEGKYLINFDYSISPDGKTLVYLFGENGFNAQSEIKGRKVYGVNKDGSSTKELTKEFAYYMSPVWADNGDHIVLVENKDIQGEPPVFMLKIIEVN